jgi:CheY-like chemotaxis protein
MWRILCVDDDEKIAKQVAEYFTAWKKENPLGEFTAVVEADFKAAKERLANERFDLVTLDLHGSADPKPEKEGENSAAQEGRQLLEELRKTRFIPVIFYTGFADKIEDLQSPVVKVVKKGQDDVAAVRDAAKALFSTGLPQLVRHVEQEQRSYLWDTVDKHWSKFAADATDSEEFSYLLARRLAHRFGREGIKELLGHPSQIARPIEFYIYPPVTSVIKTGGIYEFEGKFWLVATPACDFAQKKADRILLVGAPPLSSDSRVSDWKKTKWVPGAKEDKEGQKTFSKLNALLTNNAGERYRFLPGTFFLPDLIVDAQLMKQADTKELEKMSHKCTLDSPYREEFALHFSRYYGRLGTPDLDSRIVYERLKK